MLFPCSQQFVQYLQQGMYSAYLPDIQDDSYLQCSLIQLHIDLNRLFHANTAQTSNQQ